VSFEFINQQIYALIFLLFSSSEKKFILLKEAFENIKDTFEDMDKSANLLKT